MEYSIYWLTFSRSIFNFRIFSATSIKRMKRAKAKFTMINVLKNSSKRGGRGLNDLIKLEKNWIIKFRRGESKTPFDKMGLKNLFRNFNQFLIKTKTPFSWLEQWWSELWKVLKTLYIYIQLCFFVLSEPEMTARRKEKFISNVTAGLLNSPLRIFL